MSRSPSSALFPLFWGEGSPTKIDYRKKGTLIPTSLLEDLVLVLSNQPNRGTEPQKETSRPHVSL